MVSSSYAAATPQHPIVGENLYYFSSFKIINPSRISNEYFVDLKNAVTHANIFINALATTMEQQIIKI